MCGLVGFNGKNNFDKAKIEHLLLANMTRGVDSTGVYNGEDLLKDEDPAYIFLSKNKIRPTNIFIGHDRKTTSGKTNKSNAHPFEIDGIVGAHNGTLNNDHVVCKKLGWSWSDKDYSVDSEVLIKAIAENKLKDILKDTVGAIALIWHDKTDPNKLYCYRNTERPLYRGTIDGEGIYISSLEASLEAIGCKGIKEIREYTIYEFEDGKVTRTTNKVRTKARTGTTTTFYNESFKNKSINNYGSKHVTYDDLEDNVEPGDLVKCSKWYAGNKVTLDCHYIVAKVPGYSNKIISIYNDDNDIESIHSMYLEEENDIIAGDIVVPERVPDKLAKEKNIDKKKAYFVVQVEKNAHPTIANKSTDVIYIMTSDSQQVGLSKTCFREATSFEIQELRDESKEVFKDNDFDDDDIKDLIDDTYHCSSNYIINAVEEIKNKVSYLKDIIKANFYVDSDDISIEQINDILLDIDVIEEDVLQDSIIVLDNEKEDEKKEDVKKNN